MLSFISGYSTLHNFSTSVVPKMEEDCEDKLMSTNGGPPVPVDIEKLFLMFTTQVSSQIISQTETLREEIRCNEVRIVQDNESFQTKIRDELNELRSIIHAQQLISQSSPVYFDCSYVLINDRGNTSKFCIKYTMLDGTNDVCSYDNKCDFSGLLMLMIAESFSKLSTVHVLSRGEIYYNVLASVEPLA